MLGIARRVSSAPWRFERSLLADWIRKSNIFQSALRQHRHGTAGAIAVGSDRVTVTALWSEVVSWFTASARIDCVTDPRERHRSMVEGVRRSRDGVWGLLVRSEGGNDYLQANLQSYGLHGRHVQTVEGVPSTMGGVR